VEQRVTVNAWILANNMLQRMSARCLGWQHGLFAYGSVALAHFVARHQRAGRAAEHRRYAYFLSVIIEVRW
jgi:hypothetical protein